MSELNHVGLWNRCLEIIRDNVPEQTYKTWFVGNMELSAYDRVVVFAMPASISKIGYFFN